MPRLAERASESQAVATCSISRLWRPFSRPRRERRRVAPSQRHRGHRTPHAEHCSGQCRASAYPCGARLQTGTRPVLGASARCWERPDPVRPPTPGVFATAEESVAVAGPPRTQVPTRPGQS
jgi:hypothetical protein